MRHLPWESHSHGSWSLSVPAVCAFVLLLLVFHQCSFTHRRVQGGAFYVEFLQADMRVWEVTREPINQPLTQTASLLLLSLSLSIIYCNHCKGCRHVCFW